MENCIVKAKKIAAKYSGFDLKIEDHLIEISSNQEKSLPFALYVPENEYVFYLGNWHTHFEDEKTALEFFELSFSGEVYLQEETVLNIPYLGTFIYKGNKLEKTGTILNLLLFLFPKKTTIYRNNYPKLNEQSLQENLSVCQSCGYSSPEPSDNFCRKCGGPLG